MSLTGNVGIRKESQLELKCLDFANFIKFMNIVQHLQSRLRVVQ